MYVYLRVKEPESTHWNITATKQVMIASIVNEEADGESSFHIAVEVMTDDGPKWLRPNGWELDKDEPNLYIMPPGKYRIEAEYLPDSIDSSKNRIGWFISPTDTI